MANGTGPPYPPPAPPGGIGSFEIGVSPIGVPSPFSVWDTIISQYANSPALTGIITSFADAIDQTQNFENFYNDVWNVLTADDFGLDIWGRIVGINRVINIAAQTYFGFAEAAALEGNIGIGGFNQAPFYSGAPVTSNYRLNVETFRQLILAKMAFNVTDGAIPSINRILMNLFSGLGNAYVQEGQQQIAFFGFAESGTAFGFNQAPFYSGIVVNRMTMAYTFAFQLTAVQLGIAQSGVLPRPPGVQSSILILLPSQPVNNPPFDGPPGQMWPWHETLPDPYPLKGYRPPHLPVSISSVRVDQPPPLPNNTIFPWGLEREPQRPVVQQKPAITLAAPAINNPPWAGPLGKNWPFAEFPPDPYPINGIRTLLQSQPVNNPPFAGPLGKNWPFAELLPDPYPINGSGINYLVTGIRADSPPANRVSLPFAELPPDPYPIQGFRLQHPFVDLNLLTQSQNFSNAAWLADNSTVTSGMVAPDGTTTAFKLVETTSNSHHGLYQHTPATPSQSTTLIFSIYVKASTAQRNFEIWIYDNNFANGIGFQFNLAVVPPTLSSTITFGTGFASVSTSVTTDSLATGSGSGGNGWYRLSCSCTTNSSTSFIGYFELANGTADIYAGDGSSGNIVWGAQMNNGSFLKPYTPTTTSALYGF